MNKNNKKISLLVLLIAFLSNAVSYALPYNVVPKAGVSLPTHIILGNTVNAFYTVTNNTSRTLPNSFVKYLPPNVSQVVSDANHPDLCGTQFTLSSGASCTLELTISGEVNPIAPDPHHHLFVCSPNVPACAGTNYPLDVKAISPTVSGVVQSGAAVSQPLVNAHVTIYRADLSSSRAIGEGVTNNSGHFYIYIPPEELVQATSFYAVARVGNNIKLATVLGGDILPSITINELTTVGAAFSMAQFFHNGQIFGKSLGLKIASGMNANLVSPIDGRLSTVIMSSPNADQTNTKRSLNNLANLIAHCVRNVSNACTILFNLTTIDGVVPTNTLDALLNIAHNPANNVSLIYNQSSQLPVYVPLLANSPDAWTLAVKFNNSGSLNAPFGGAAKTIFDKYGNAWITNNVVQGTPDSSHWIMVLKPNGQPADGANNTPVSPIFGGGLLGNAFGITIDTKGSIWAGNFGWGSCNGCLPPGGEGSVSKISSTGIPISGTLGYVNYLYRAQGTVSDKYDNIWIASYGNDRVVVYLNGDPNSAVYFQQPINSGTFDIAIAQDGSAWVTSTKSAVINKYILTNNTLIQTLSIQLPADSRPKAVSIDSQGNAWVAATGAVLQTEPAILRITPQGAVTSYNDGRGGVSAPWGVTIDGDDNIWVANFEPENNTMPIKYSISKLCGINPAKCPSGLQTGDAISPATGYTLPSAGSEVLLADGTPLNGIGGPPSFHPLMRLTHAISDQAGNVWAANNWKPLPYSENHFNPGGDGVVVFIGLASPPNVD
ncbi:hypothetical protein [uncultured Legionella sp.]|uniref:Vgb family protein n=1 Tax=uncultured Legionella sp. TaxID=210934 RepID=UPI002629405F|nr:hypothetical protein [uncultured Legionella sp.]